MTTITVKGLNIGIGAPKIIVPIVSKTEQDLIDEVELLKDIDFDILEWRVDHFNYVDDIEKVKQAASKINRIIGHKPILFTFRTANEGGVFPASVEFYLDLNKKMITSGFIDFVDIEVFTGDNYVKDIIALAHQNNVLVITSNHDFDKTPSKSDIIYRLRKMQDLGADIPKIAVMPRSIDDVLTLLSATAEMKEKYAKKPLITMSMAGKGAISRVAGETFGSDLTFGAAKNASAPGQLDVKELRYILNVLHRSIS
ncbi:type I 3-dehydroquinate dehydratase [Orbus wheelerorum]|uniref:type I 3-dehydroquinate dehydratase n=1 Tax=Orbus wheelerorum TaxID=3074111 RepID=UPI00370D3DF0